MRSLLFVTAVFLTTFSAAQAEQPQEELPAPAAVVLSPELVQAHYDYQLALVRLQEYRHVTLPQQRRQLNEDIRLTDEEVRILKRRQRDYRPFLQVDEYSPVRTAAESHRLALLSAQSRTRQLRDARINQMRFTRQNYQLLQLELLHSAARLNQLQRASQAE